MTSSLKVSGSNPNPMASGAAPASGTATRSPFRVPARMDQPHPAAGAGWQAAPRHDPLATDVRHDWFRPVRRACTISGRTPASLHEPRRRCRKPVSCRSSWGNMGKRREIPDKTRRIAAPWCRPQSPPILGNGERLASHDRAARPARPGTIRMQTDDHLHHPESPDRTRDQPESQGSDTSTDPAPHP